ncbi:MAG: tetratricopeptide repeat protein [Rubrivivax sp.]
MSPFLRWCRGAAAFTLVAAAIAAGAAPVPTAPVDTDPEAPTHSALDAALFYQLLIGEMHLRGGDPGTAYQAFIDAARRTRDPLLFRRAMDIALQARAGNEALAATGAWREALPASAEPLRLELQIMAVLNKLDTAGPTLRALLDRTPAPERNGLITALPRLFERANDKRQTALLLEQVLQPEIDAEATRAAAVVALARSWLAAGDPDRALALAERASVADPTAPGPALLSLELLAQRPQAEAIVQRHLQRPGAEPALRLAYVRALAVAQRYADAVAQLEIATRAQADVAPPYLTLGALQLELKRLPEAEAALLRFIELTDAPQAPAAPAAASAASAAPATAAAPGDEDADASGAAAGRVQAWLLLAQVAERRGDYAGAERWLARIDDPRRALEVQTRRALILARQGQVDAAVASLRLVPERSPEDARAKLIAEAELLRDVKRWQASYEVFGVAVARFPDDTDLLYEQAMMAEKADRLDDMERLLRRVIELKPDHGHAQNALGYSLADRGQRLPEARALIQRALELQPGDPFITDSLGWAEYRLGNHDEALRLLRMAWSTRPDTEIGAHLGEVLWASGQREEAKRIWRQAQSRDSGNEVLRETLARLQVGL